MENWKYLEIPNYDIIRNKLEKIIQKYKHLLKHGVLIINRETPELVADITMIEELMDFLENKKWLRYVHEYSLVVIEPNKEYGIHIDGNAIAPYISRHRVLLPVTLNEGVYTRFWKTNGEPCKIHYVSADGVKQELLEYDKRICEEIDRYELTKPVVMDSIVPHSVDTNFYPSIRIAIGINFNRNINIEK